MSREWVEWSDPCSISKSETRPRLDGSSVPRCLALAAWAVWTRLSVRFIVRALAWQPIRRSLGLGVELDWEVIHTMTKSSVTIQ
jgi:hypothetical protein